jgi:two-component system nitrate/nitrite response regulator NarL
MISQTKHRIAVIDDHPLYREGVVLTLSRDAAFEIVGEGGTADQAVRLAEETSPDIMLLDIGLPGGGIEAIARVLRVSPVTKVVMLTGSESEDHVSTALESGARGYVLKGIGAQELVRTIRAIASGETYVTPGLAARLLTQMKSRAATPPQGDQVGLTQREEQILQCVANGRTNKEIARELNLSEKTVKHYMTNIMHKLQVRNRVEAALIVRRRAKQA